MKSNSREYSNQKGSIVGKYVSPYPIKLSSEMPTESESGKPIIVKKDKKNGTTKLGKEL